MKLLAPPYVVAHPGDNSGCGYHRVMRPLELLSRSGYIAGRVEINFLPNDILKPIEPDVVIWQRQNQDFQIKTIERYREQVPAAIFVFEIDDALSAIPDKSWHKPFMTPNVDAGIAKAISLCDVVTVTTDDLKAHIEAIAPGARVIVQPNMISNDDLQKIAEVKKHLPPKPIGHARRLRIGWGGGIGHQGDIDILAPVMEALRDEVEWVFLGFDPKLPPGISKTFAGGAPPPNYLQALSSLDVDLAIAPLEDNLFNRCKSNLRLLEAGACEYPVIASPVAPYLTRKPPVYGYADSTEKWVELIRNFAKLTDAGRKTHGEAMARWVRRHYLFDDHMEERVRGWLSPRGAEPFVPKRMGAGRGIAIGHTPKELIQACQDTSSDVVFVRSDIEVSRAVIDRFVANCQIENVAAACTGTNDGGPTGFPVANQFTPLSNEFCDKIVEISKDLSGNAQLYAANGPVVLLRRQALAMLGMPNFENWENPEIAILEWSINASGRGYKNIVDFGTYIPVQQPGQGDPQVVQQASFRMAARWPQGQNDEAALQKYRERLELEFHKRTFRAPIPLNRADYQNWASLHDTMGPKSLERCLAWYNAKERPSIEFVAYGEDKLTGDQLAAIKSEWVIFAPHDAIPAMGMIALFSEAIEHYPTAKILYGDNDYMINGARQAHDFKPNFDRHLLFGRDYVTPVMAVNWRAIGNDLQNTTPGPDAIRLYELVLNHSDRIVHVPRILAHLNPQDPLTVARNTQLRARVATNYAIASGLPIRVNPHPTLPGFCEVIYRDPDNPKVSIILPTKNKVEMLGPCLATLLSMTDYPNFEILIVDNGSDRPDMLEFLSIENPLMQDPRVRVVRWAEPYNWSKLNNWAVGQLENPEILCFLNDDTRVLARHWLDEMVGTALFPGVGAVGARLLYPHRQIQHVGVVASGGVNGHLHKGMPAQLPGYNGIAALSHENVAVTGACMVVRHQLFEAVGRFDENLGDNFNDVLFCVELGRRGYANVVNTRAELEHLEGVTRVTVVTQEGRDIMARDGRYLHSKYQENDKYWNPNLMFFALQGGMMMAGLNCDQLMWPPPPMPWEEEEYARILLLGPPESGLPEIRDGAAVYHLSIDGYKAQISNPPLNNVRPFDLRKPEEALERLAELGIDLVMITSLGPSSTDALAFLSRLQRPVLYRPLDAESVCPRRNLRPNGEMCGNGWREPGACESCITINSSPNGYVSAENWRRDWGRFFGHGNVQANFELLMAPEFLTAISDVWGDGIADKSDPEPLEITEEASLE
jgi:GT2 family glycosyltransferase/glycosyltransferase involved in cell wall biosynthesis